MRNAVAWVSSPVVTMPVAVLAVWMTASASAMAQAVDLGWARLPAGTFRMGCVESDTACLDNERPRHEVTFLEPFEMMAAEVTVVQYAQFVADSQYAEPPSPDFPQAADHPVVLLSWDDAVAFCAWGGGRLPTEAEWEYAARGGRDGLVFGTSQELVRDQANYGADQCCSGATGDGDAWTNTAPVRSFAPNDFGLFDMTGNVWEWVSDWYGDDYYRHSPDENPPGPETGIYRVVKGGGWADEVESDVNSLRISNRSSYGPELRFMHTGFRCAQ